MKRCRIFYVVLDIAIDNGIIFWKCHDTLWCEL